MSRISRLDRSEVSAEVAALYDKAFAQRGNVPNMFRVMAHRPEIFATMQAHFAAVLNTGTVSTKLKELIIVRTSQVNETPYCLASHTILARNLGWSDEQLAHLPSWRERDDFTRLSQSRLGLCPGCVRISTMSPECSLCRSGTMRPFTFAPMQVWPTSVWMEYAKSRGLASLGSTTTLPLGVKV